MSGWSTPIDSCSLLHDVTVEDFCLQKPVLMPVQIRQVIHGFQGLRGLITNRLLVCFESLDQERLGFSEQTQTGIHHANNRLKAGVHTGLVAQAAFQLTCPLVENVACCERFATCFRRIGNLEQANKEVRHLLCRDGSSLARRASLFARSLLARDPLGLHRHHNGKNSQEKEQGSGTEDAEPMPLHELPRPIRCAGWARQDG